MKDLAQKAGLRYANDSEAGFQRKPWGRGFTYLDKEGNHITNGEARARLEDLVIPPAWTGVWICPHPKGHIQATGRDDKGRKQYIYHPGWEEVRDSVKFQRMAAFAELLPQLRAQIDTDLNSRKLSQTKVVALVIRLLDKTLLRIGNTVYAEENGSYGLTTLQDEHTAVSGSSLTFSFPGKGGKHQEVHLRDRRLARLVQECQDLPGQDLFQYVGEDGNWYSLTSTEVNDYLQQHTGQDFSAKDFRTWGATVAAAEKLAEIGPAKSQTQRKKNIAEAVKHAARMLGNTPTVCRQYYIHPLVAEAYETGELAARLASIQAGQGEKKGLSEIETAVLKILQT